MADGIMPLLELGCFPGDVAVVLSEGNLSRFGIRSSRQPALVKPPIASGNPRKKIHTPRDPRISLKGEFRTGRRNPSAIPTGGRKPTLRTQLPPAW